MGQSLGSRGNSPAPRAPLTVDCVCCRWVVATQRREIGRVLCLLCAQGGGRSRPSERKAPASGFHGRAGQDAGRRQKGHGTYVAAAVRWKATRVQSSEFIRARVQANRLG